MARVSTHQSISAWLLVVLAFLVCSLAVHFFVEEPVVVSGHPSITPLAESLDELADQDDAALTVHLPQRISANCPFLGFSAILSSEVQAVFPILHPPKI